MGSVMTALIDPSGIFSVLSAIGDLDSTYHTQPDAITIGQVLNAMITFSKFQGDCVFYLLFCCV